MPVADQESLSRYILFGSHIRQNNTIRPDAFIPYPHPDLSVTRHGDLNIAGIWRIGEIVAKDRDKTLKGRADTLSGAYLGKTLQTIEAPTPDNPNHINVTGWPPDKPSQKIIALEISAQSSFIPHPN